jgi:hypothetical protein
LLFYWQYLYFLKFEVIIWLVQHSIWRRIEPGPETSYELGIGPATQNEQFTATTAESRTAILRNLKTNTELLSFTVWCLGEWGTEAHLTHRLAHAITAVYGAVKATRKLTSFSVTNQLHRMYWQDHEALLDQRHS